MATVLYGDFEWDDVKARANLAKHGVSFEEASTVFADPCYILRMDDVDPDGFVALGLSGLAWSCISSADPGCASLVLARQRRARKRPMSNDTSDRKNGEPSAEELEEIPEVDFSKGIQPHRYARLKSGYQYTVFLEPELWQHFGSADEVKAALRALVNASRHVRAAG